MLGGDIRPVKVIADPFPIVNGIAVDSENDLVVVSDVNKKGIMMFDRSVKPGVNEVVKPKRYIIGSLENNLGFVAGVALDPETGEIFVVNNDIEDRMAVFGYEDDGNVRPKRVMMIPHRAWGISVTEDEIFITVQTFGLVVFPRGLEGCPEPARSILGVNSGMADPHGVYVDKKYGEIIVANHGNWNQEGAQYGMESSTDIGWGVQMKYGGRYLPPSITIYPINASGDIPPSRTIAGPSTSLNWPMGVHMDSKSGEIVVANNGDDSVVFFNRAADGDAAPTRVIRGEKTGIKRPVGVFVDEANDELWVANFGDYSILVFDRYVEGNAPPKRILRTAPYGTPLIGFANPMAATYDSKRDEWIIANCVTQPRIYTFDISFSGSGIPKRLIDGQKTRLTRTMHGIAYNPVRDELVVPAPLAAAILIFKGEADGESQPVRVIQGPKTTLVYPHVASLDVKRQEILVGDPGRGAVIVFDVTSNGDMSPKRVISGSRTGLDYVVGVCTDPDRRLLVVASSAVGRVSGAQTGIYFFDIDANGNVEPLKVISGPKTGIKNYPWDVRVFMGHVFVAVHNTNYLPCFKLDKCIPGRAQLHSVPWTTDGFVGIWSLDDEGDVEPKAVIKGPISGIAAPGPLALNHKTGELLITDSVRNAAFIYRITDIIQTLS
jgi:DNA-binding beta-propeller fold protein YncE